MSIKIAHISDLHLRNQMPGPPSFPGRRGRELFNRLPELFEKLKKLKADVIVVTGDLLDVPRWFIKEGFYYVYDFSYWEQMVYLDYMAVQSLFVNCGIPTLFLPGNHDHPGLFRKVFGRQLEPVEIKGFTFYCFADWPFRGSKARRLDKERKLFDQSLESGPENQIHCQHYIIAPWIESSYPYNYLEYRELYQRVAGSRKVRLCLSGHYHQGAELSINSTEGGGEIYFSTAESLSETPFPYYLFELSNQRVKKTKFSLGEIAPPRPAVFLDRDGCITEAPRFNSGPGELKLLEGAIQALLELKGMGYALVVLSDQSAVGKGYLLKETVHWAHDELSRQLAEKGIQMDGFYFSTGAGRAAVLKEFEDRRKSKPSSELIFQAQKELNLNLERSVMVGDRLSDCICGWEAGLPAFLVRTGFGRSEEKKIRSSKSITVVDSIRELPGILKKNSI